MRFQYSATVCFPLHICIRNLVWLDRFRQHPELQQQRSQPKINNRTIVHIGLEAWSNDVIKRSH